MHNSRMKAVSMKRFLLAILLLWVLPGSALAEKIGYVEVRRLIDESPQGQVEQKRLEDAFAERNREIKGRVELFESRRADLEKNAVLMTEEEVARVSEELQEMQRVIRREQRDYNEEYNDSRNRSLAQLQKTISDAVVHVARRDNYDLIFQQAVFVSDRIDITEEVLKELVRRAEQ